MTEKVNGLADNEIAICVSHDWNIFPSRSLPRDCPTRKPGTSDTWTGWCF